MSRWSPRDSTLCISGKSRRIKTCFPWLGLDPAIHFEPVFNIIKNALPCVKFDVQPFNERCAKTDVIRNHCQGVTTNCGKLQISKDITISLLRIFGNPSIEFTAGVQSANKRWVTIAAATWDCISNLMPLLRQPFYTLTAAKPHVKKLRALVLLAIHTLIADQRRVLFQFGRRSNMHLELPEPRHTNKGCDSADAKID